MNAIDINTVLTLVAKDLPGSIAKANATLGTVGTSIPALEKAAKQMAEDAFSDPGATIPQVLEAGVSVAFAANPIVGIIATLVIGAFTSGLVKPADWEDYAIRGDPDNPYADSEKAAAEKALRDRS